MDNSFCDAGGAINRLISVSCISSRYHLVTRVYTYKCDVLEATLKRHKYYCQSRRVTDITGSRACISCARGKARCDNRQPECSRCITKAIECHYPANTPKSPGRRIQHSDGVSPSTESGASVSGRSSQCRRSPRRLQQ